MPHLETLQDLLAFRLVDRQTMRAVEPVWNFTLHCRVSVSNMWPSLTITTPSLTRVSACNQLLKQYSELYSKRWIELEGISNLANLMAGVKLHAPLRLAHLPRNATKLDKTLLIIRQAARREVSVALNWQGQDDGVVRVLARHIAQGFPASKIILAESGPGNMILSPDSAGALFHALPGSRVQGLQLVGAIVYSESIALLAQVLPVSQVKLLEISYGKLDDGDADLLFAALPFTQVRELYLSGNQFTATSMKFLFHALKNITRRLEILDLSSNLVGDKGALFLSLAFRTRSSLRALHVSNMGITATGCSHILKLVPELVVLGLSENQHISGCLGKLPASTTLEQLHLSNNYLSEEDGMSLASALERIPKLKLLDVSGNYLDDISVCAIVAALPGSVERVDLRGCPFLTYKTNGMLYMLYNAGKLRRSPIYLLN